MLRAAAGAGAPSSHADRFGAASRLGQGGLGFAWLGLAWVWLAFLRIRLGFGMISVGLGLISVGFGLDFGWIQLGFRLGFRPIIVLIALIAL